MRVRGRRSTEAISTLSGLEADAPASPAGGATSAPMMQGLRKRLLRIGVTNAVLTITLAACGLSVGVTLAIFAVFPPPAAQLPISLGFSVLIPLLAAPPIGWIIVRLMFEAEAARRVAERLAVTDPLTQVFNRRHFFAVGERGFARVKGAGQALSVLLLDIDNFKSVNDQHGHAVGDQVLKAVAQTCRDGLRGKELLARFGGEEFVVLLPETALVTAAEVAERLRRSVEMLAVAGEGDAVIRPTVSIGVATASAAADSLGSLDQLLAVADQAMYLAKRSGRNRVVSEPPAA